MIDLAKDTKAKLKAASEPLKEVGIRVDRADGFVIRNVTAAHAAEHGIYIHETDGYLMQRVKFFYNKEYGGLMFTSDHGLTTDCEGVGHGDSAIYPGAAAETGEQTKEPSRRVNNTITRCDIHHNTLGYSGTMGNGTRVVGNHFYDNGTAITTDSFYAGGHPGYPQDGATFENNQIYSNNFNSFVAELGRGAEGAGAGRRRDLHRRRQRQRDPRQPDLRQLAPRHDADQRARTRSRTRSARRVNSVSHRNRYHDNVMGIAPDGTKMPNGVDFWWDEAPNQQDNCWFDNGEATTDPPGPLMPSNCENTSAGVTYPGKFSGELAPCAGLDRGRRLRREHLPVVPHAGRSPPPAVTAAWACPCKASGAPKVTLLSGELPHRGLDRVVRRAARPALVAATAAAWLRAAGDSPRPRSPSA